MAWADSYTCRNCERDIQYETETEGVESYWWHTENESFWCHLSFGGSDYAEPDAASRRRFSLLSDLRAVLTGD